MTAPKKGPVEFWAWLNMHGEIVYNGTKADCLRWYATQSSTSACDLVRQ